MPTLEKLATELKAMTFAASYFGAWFGVLALLKRLILEEYGIDLPGFAFALIGALIVAKVVLVLEHVSLGRWVNRHPALVDVLLRTLLYGLGVILVLLLEKAFDGRHDYGGFTASLRHLFQHADIYHVWIDSIVIALSLLVFNVFTVIRRHLGTGGLARLLLSPPGQSAPYGDVSPAAQPNRSGAPLAGRREG